MKVVWNLHLRAPAERVFATLCTEAFNVDVESKREGVVSTSFRQIAEGDRAVFELHTVEYARTKLGKLDRSTSFESVTRSEVDTANRTLAWAYRGGESKAKRFKLSGVYKVANDGEGTKLTHEVTIEVDIPVVGEQIAKLMSKEIDGTMPLIEAALGRHMVP